MEDETLGDSGLLSDLLGRGGVEALRCEQPQRRLEDLLSTSRRCRCRDVGCRSVGVLPSRIPRLPSASHVEWILIEYILSLHCGRAPVNKPGLTPRQIDCNNDPRP